jgi:predicted NBD/HSP70 family sugar kinase
MFRTLLFIPGNNKRFIEKVKSLNADIICFDLEDSVPLNEKQTARDFVSQALDKKAYNKYEPKDPNLHEALPQFLRDAAEYNPSYATKLIRLFTAAFAVGLANLQYLLDLDHINLGGHILTTVRDIDEGFSSRLQQAVEQRMHSSFVSADIFHTLTVDTEVLRGAALLFFDPSVSLAQRMEDGETG